MGRNCSFRVHKHLHLLYLMKIRRYVSILCASSTLPDSEKGDILFPLVPPFSLLLTDEDELGLGVKALLENCRVLPSKKRRMCVKKWSHGGRSN